MYCVGILRFLQWNKISLIGTGFVSINSEFVSINCYYTSHKKSISLIVYLIDTEFGPGEDCICGEYMSRGQSISICLDVVLCGGSHVSSVAVPAEKVPQDPIYRKTGLTSSHWGSNSLPRCLSKRCNTCDVRWEKRCMQQT